MRELALNEVEMISGGKPNDGYNFSHIVSNGLTIGVICAIFGGSFTTGVIVGVSYASLMMMAKALDTYYFPESADTVVVTQTNFVDPKTTTVSTPVTA